MSDGFTDAWLDLREPYDAAARDAALARRLAAWADPRGHLRICDLGSGTGANLRWLAPRLTVPQSWTLVELDGALIAAGEERLRAAPVPWRYRRLDLARHLEALAEEAPELITGSALLDLVSTAWLERLAALAVTCGAAVYLALTIDGRPVWDPIDPADDEVGSALARHQMTDKGFGPAAGGGAAKALKAALAGGRGVLALARSDWVLDPTEDALQKVLLDGYAAAASTIADRPHEVAAWAQRRRRQITAGRSRLRVGHLDLLFLPLSAEARRAGS